MEPPLRFEPMRPGEETEVSRLVWEVFAEFEAQGYDPDGIREFQSFIAAEAMAERVARGGFFVLCCRCGEQLAGVAAVRMGSHLSLLFVRREFQKRGIARRLIDLVLAHCLVERPDLEALTVHSSRYALPIYQRLGFGATGPEQEENGIRFIPMRYPLKAAGSMRQTTFVPEQAREILRNFPTVSAVFALYGADPRDEPYIGRTPNLRSRLERLLQPSEKHPKRLQLAGRVRRIAWRLTGSEFESLLVQFNLLQGVYGAKCLERMHLRAPALVRFLGANPYPRVVVTNRPVQREADWAYGPFPSRVAAERYADEMLKLFLLRRCIDDLHPDPSFPGCVYSEMKMCLAPCYRGCTDERYAEESGAVERFLATRGESRLVTLRAERDEASANLEFEQAAALHAQVQKVEAVRGLASELVRPLSRLRAVILQAAALPDEVAVFLFENGRLRGPAGFSTIGMRIQNEQSGSTSRFAQPMMLEAVPERQGAERQGPRDQETEGPMEVDVKPKVPRSALEARMEEVLTALGRDRSAPSAVERRGHLALLKRWYYRPEVRRAGEIFFPDAEGQWPVKAILRGIGRVAAKSLTDANQN